MFGLVDALAQYIPPAVVKLAIISDGQDIWLFQYLAESHEARPSLVLENLYISYRQRSDNLPRSIKRREGSHPPVHTGRKPSAIMKPFNYDGARRQPGLEDLDIDG